MGGLNIHLVDIFTSINIASKVDLALYYTRSGSLIIDFYKVLRS